MMSIFDKFQQLAAARQELAESCDTFFNVVMEEILSGTEAIVNGRPTILAGSNNYLGLSFDPDCVDAACEAARKEGTGTTGSRMANGTFSGHLALEQNYRNFSTVEAPSFFPPAMSPIWPCCPPWWVLAKSSCWMGIATPAFMTVVEWEALKSIVSATTIRKTWKNDCDGLKNVIPTF
jgi:hypothetical protein